MLPNAQKQTVHIDQGVTKEFVMRMSDDVTDAAFVLQTMTDLYSIKPLAVIREVSTNAWDSHLAAGQTRPIEVTLPTAGSTPMFVVQDWGVGLDADDMENIFVQYGKSTKRQNVTATGMLGLGCKAPLTYCLSFTVVGVKNGVKTVAVVSKQDNGVGTMKVLSELPTDEPNGVTVSVPVTNVDEFNTHANDFFKYWRDGVLVNGEPPATIEPSLVLDDDLWVFASGFGHSVIVQGGVPYTYNTPHGLPRTVAWVPMGSVDFVPSREALHHTDETKEAIKLITEYVWETLGRVVQFEIDRAEATSTYELYRTILRLNEALPRGFDRPALKVRSRMYSLSFHKGKDRGNLKSMRYGWHVYRDTATRHDWVKESWILSDRIVFITDFPYKSVSTVHKEQLEHAGIDECVLVPDTATIDLDGFPTRTWETIPRLPAKVRQQTHRARLSPRTETLYPFYENGILTRFATYPGNKDTVLYLITSDHGEAGTSIARSVSELFPEVVVGAIITTQEDKFRRLHPNAKPWQPWVKAQVKKLERKITKADRRYLESAAWERSLSKTFKDVWRDVKDPQLRQHMNLAGTTSPALRTLQQIQSSLGLSAGITPELSTQMRHIRDGGNRRIPNGAYVAEHYPLLAAGRYDLNYTESTPDEWVLYLNAKWAHIKKARKNNDDTADAA